MNWPLFSMIYSMTSTVVMGLFMIVVLATMPNSSIELIIAIAVGAVISIPIAFVVTKKIRKLGESSNNSTPT